jgi:hypothetical protein
VYPLPSFTIVFDVVQQPSHLPDWSDTTTITIDAVTITTTITIFRILLIPSFLTSLRTTITITTVTIITIPVFSLLVCCLFRL